MEKYIKPEILNLKTHEELMENWVKNGIMEDPSIVESAIRQFWINRGLEKSMGLADKILEIVREIDPEYSLNYARLYAGLSRNGISDNFIYLSPEQYGIRLNIKRGPNDGLQKFLEASTLDVSCIRSSIYTIRLGEKDIEGNRDVIKELIKRAYDYHSYKKYRC